MEDTRSAVSPSRPSRRKTVFWVIFACILLFAMYQALNPFRGGREYVPIGHGDHFHYVPPDRDPEVSLSAFPTQPPGPNERIMPDGRVVPK